MCESAGLFYHTLDSPYFWGRGNGWAASSMAEVLMNMPQSHPLRSTIMNAYTRMMAALKKNQDPGGMWHQVITTPSSYLESSCTGMFIFAIATGIRMGWLPEDEYLPVVEQGWRGLAPNVNSDGNVENVCIGTGEGFSLDYYLTRPTSTGDLHIQAAVLWGAVGVILLCQ